MIGKNLKTQKGKKNNNSNKQKKEKWLKKVQPKKS